MLQEFIAIRHLLFEIDVRIPCPISISIIEVELLGSAENIREADVNCLGSSKPKIKLIRPSNERF